MGKQISRMLGARNNDIQTNTKHVSDLPLGVAPFPKYKFPTPFIQHDYDGGAAPFSRIEQQIMLGMGAIKSKPCWWVKIKDASIRARWADEMSASFVAFLSQPVSWTYVGADKSPLDDKGRAAAAQLWARVVLDELSEEADTVQVSKVVNGGAAVYSPGPVRGTWISDTAVSDDVRAELSRLVAPLENPVDSFTGLPKGRDYHPGSGNQVIDLVHPSLYPLVTGRSLVVPVDGEESIFSWRRTIGTGAVLTAPEKPKREGQHWTPLEFHSEKFQWLPSEIDVRAADTVAGDGPRVVPPCSATFRSYINNLHPQDHAELYRVLERIFAEAFVPLFNNVLSEAVSDLSNVRCHENSMDEVDLYIKFVAPEECDDEDEAWCEWRETRVPRVDTSCVMKRADALAELRKAKRSRSEGESNTTTTIRIGEDPQPTRLQVIVKLATIELTPESPTYSGGSWHVEGMSNESIVASGIYYWCSENVVGGHAGQADSGAPTVLSFRTSVSEPSYEQNDNDGVDAVFGLRDEEALIQDMGSVDTIEGRCLAWPNSLQHQVQPFRLADAAKPGYRKILVFFLVDPSKRVVSTSSVPPQDEEWMLRELMCRKAEAGEDKAPAAALFGDRDLAGEVLGYAWHFPRRDALTLREELMKERKVFTDDTMKEAYERPFSLCEH